MLPGLSNSEKRYFLGISHGKVTHRIAQGETEVYDNFEGEFKGITTRNATVNGELEVFYDLTFVNSGYTYQLSVPRAGSVARGLILCLASVKSFRNAIIRISPYNKTNPSKPDKVFTNVAVYCNGQKLDWAYSIEQLPETKVVVVGNKKVTDDVERLKFIDNLVNAINATLQQVEDLETGEFRSPAVDVDDNFDDMPEDLG